MMRTNRDLRRQCASLCRRTAKALEAVTEFEAENDAFSAGLAHQIAMGLNAKLVPMMQALRTDYTRAIERNLAQG